MEARECFRRVDYLEAWNRLLCRLTYSMVGRRCSSPLTALDMYSVYSIKITENVSPLLKCLRADEKKWINLIVKKYPVNRNLDSSFSVQFEDFC